MALARIWTFLFVSGFGLALFKWLARGEREVFAALSNALLEAAKTGVTISLGLIGVMALWLGIMRMGEKGGLIEGLARLLAPVLRRIFPDVPKGHPALGAMIMNFSANMLGLDSAATPLGLQAMRELQTLNPDPDRASNAQLMFTIINTAGLTLIPVSVMAYRAQFGAANPADVFVPAMIGTIISALSGFLIVCSLQRIKLWHPALLFPILGVMGVLALVLWQASRLSQEALSSLSLFAGNLLVVLIVVTFLLACVRKGHNVYETFVDGAKEGFTVAVGIIPYLVAMLIAIAFFRASGALGYVLKGLELACEAAGLPTTFVPALPTALMKPLSGSGARGLMIETLKTYGADSFVGRLVSTVQGSTETTFYVIALYYGSVGVKNTRYTLWVGLLVDLIGTIAAIMLAYLFFV